jgi:hypothetical protein
MNREGDSKKVCDEADEADGAEHGAEHGAGGTTYLGVALLNLHYFPTTLTLLQPQINNNITASKTKNLVNKTAKSWACLSGITTSLHAIPAWSNLIPSLRSCRASALAE